MAAAVRRAPVGGGDDVDDVHDGDSDVYGPALPERDTAHRRNDCFMNEL